MPDAQNLPEVYTVEEIAIRLKAHPETIRRLIKSGKLKAFKLGGQYRVTAKELDRYLAEIGYRVA